jgi:hypothetical protein
LVNAVILSTNANPLWKNSPARHDYLSDLPLGLVWPHMNRKAYNSKLSAELADDHETMQD